MSYNCPVVVYKLWLGSYHTFLLYYISVSLPFSFHAALLSNKGLLNNHSEHIFYIASVLVNYNNHKSTISSIPPYCISSIINIWLYP